MATAQDIEGFLIRMGISYEEIGENRWMIHDEFEQVDNIQVYLNEPVVLFHVKLMDIPENCDRLGLFTELLTLNVEDMMAGAYGLQGDAVVATDTLQAENLDYNEFQASVDALQLCISSHYPKLQAYHQQSG